MKGLTKPDGLYPNFLNPNTGNWGTSKGTPHLTPPLLPSPHLTVIIFPILHTHAHMHARTHTCTHTHAHTHACTHAHTRTYTHTHAHTHTHARTHAHTHTGHISMGALGDSFYEYLLKSWLMTSKADTEARDMYYDAINVSSSDKNTSSSFCSSLSSSLFLVPPHFLPSSLSPQAMEKQLFQKTSSGLTLVADVKSGRQDNKMQHLVSNKLCSTYLIPYSCFRK